MIIAAMIAWEVFACGLLFGMAYFHIRRIRRQTEAELDSLREKLERSRADRIGEAEPEPTEPHVIGA